MKENMERATIEETCRRWLLVTTIFVDEGRESAYDGYNWAYLKMDGLASGLLNLYQFELYEIVKYYRNIACNRMHSKHKRY